MSQSSGERITGTILSIYAAFGRTIIIHNDHFTTLHMLTDSDQDNPHGDYHCNASHDAKNYLAK